MQNVNEVRFIGNLGKAPVMKQISSDFKVINFSLATSESYEKDNEKITVTQWHYCEARNKLAEICAEYLKQGSNIYVTGKLTYDKYIPEGATKEINSAKIILDQVVFLDKKAE